MKDTLDDVRLSDFVLTEQKKITSSIEEQFPAIYREDGRELIELVKAYYTFLEENEKQSTFNIRRIYEYRNIDSTLERMLIFFKNKFLNGLFFQEDIRFVVKNILDLYRRKGSKEGVDLFFKLFFNEEVDTFFPSQNIFKPSTSLFQIGPYIQLYSVTDISIFNNITNKRIFGDKSTAEGTVDTILFVSVNNSLVPIVLLENIKGQFTRFDNIYSNDPLIVYGRVYGSLRSVSIPRDTPGTGGNKIGDIVEITSNVGFGAKGRVTDVSEQISGEITFDIADGNYGYTTINTDILVSEQSIFFASGVGNEFIINERVRQSKANTDIFATVLGKTLDSIGIFLDYRELKDQFLFIQTDGNEFNPNEEIVQTNSYGIQVFGNVVFEEVDFIVVELNKTANNVLQDVQSQRYFFEKNFPISTVGRVTELQKQVIEVDDDYFFEDGFDITTVGRPTGQNISRSPLFVTQVNNSARADIGTIDNTETIRIITDLIQDFLDVQLDSENYSAVPPALDEMSGTKINGVIPDLDTPLNEAFVPEEFTIGEITSLSNINPGIDHFANVFVLARENVLSKFNIRNQIINISIPSGVILFEGDIVTQLREKETFEGNTEIVEVRGEIISINGNNITTKQRSFNSFINDEPIFKQGTDIPISINFAGRDLINPPLGLNARIDGRVEDVFGKIQAIDVIDSGFAYEDESIVNIINVSKQNNNGIDATGVASATRQGITEGTWKSFESQINQEKVIQDSFFHQDFSYQLTTGLSSDEFESEYRDVMHPAGFKLFTRFGKIDIINIKINVPEETVELFDELLVEVTEVFQANNNFIYLSSSV
jgi:hypothetical protein